MQVIDDHGYIVLGPSRGVTLAEVDDYLDSGYA
jgi:hypothetical protein